MRSIAHPWLPRTACAGAIALVLVLGGGGLTPANAQRGGGPTPQRAPAAQGANDKEQSAEYRQLVQQALDEFQRGNWDEAAGLFAQAHKLSPSARTLRGMGLAAFEGRRYVDALGYLRAALDSTANPLTTQQRAEVTDTVERAEHYVAKLELTVEPSTAEVRVNGVDVQPQADGTRLIMVDPGMVEVRASSPGYELEVQQLRMVSGARQQLALRLGRAGNEQIAGPQDATGGGRVAPARQSSGTPFKTLAWLSVGLAAASGIAAVVSWRVREDAASVYNSATCVKPDMTRDETCSDARDRVDSADTAGIISGVAAGTFLTAAVVMFVLDANANEGEEAAQACGAGPGDLGVSCRMRF